MYGINRWMISKGTGSPNRPGEKRAVVIDNGPRRINAGFAGHHVLSATMPAVIGAPKYEGILFMNSEDDYTYGDEALASFRTHTLHQCLPGMGQKANWQYVERLWNHIFSHRLQMSPTDQPLLLTFSSSFSVSDTAHIARIVFERLQAPALYIGLRCVLTLRSMRLDTGLVLEIGKDSSTATCVSNGLIVESSIEHSRNSYETILENCKQVSLGDERRALIEDFESLQTDSVPRHGFIAPDYRVELGKLRWPRDAIYTQAEGAPDRTNGNNGASPGEFDTRSFSKACFEAPEVLFQPKMFDFLLESLQELAVRSVQLCKSEDQPRLYNNVHLIGETCRIPGIASRLQKEIQALVPPEMRVDVSIPKDPESASWIGASQLAADVDSFEKMCVSRDEYETYGLDAIRTRFHYRA